MDNYIKTCIANACDYLRAFEQSLKLAALKNDGVVDREEQKLLDKANALTEKYIKSLEKLTD